MTKPVLDYLILAPHASIPPHDGASLRSVELARSLMRLGCSVRLVALNGDYCSLESFVEPLPAQPERSRSYAGFLGVLTGQGYHAAKFLTPEWSRRAQRALNAYSAKVVYIHFLWTSYPFLRKLKGQRLIVDTHNYDPEIYNNLTGSARNPVVRMLGAFSTRRSINALRAIPRGQPILHVTEGDVRRYRLLSPGLRHVLLPNGCVLRPRTARPTYDQPKKQLYFLGLLSVMMNFDALRFFADKIWPRVKGASEMTVFGRSPSREVVELCRTNSWRLVPDIPEKDLQVELENMHFAILPFEYAAGSKLKLLDACARGIPVISTPEGVRGHSTLPDAVHVLYDPQSWEELINSNESPSSFEIEALLNYARTFTWDGLAAQLNAIVRSDSDRIKLP